jgi:PAS domain S-box-containing protein
VEYWANPHLKDGRVVGAVMSFIDITERKREEEVLLESEERFKKLSSFTFEGILIHKNLIVVDVNESMLKLLGYERNEIFGMNIFNVISPDYHAIVKYNAMKQIATPYQIVAVRKDGSFFDAEIEGKNINYNGEDFRVACIRDITERKKTEVALQETKERLKFAIEVSGLGEWELDLKTNKIKRDERWAEMLGYRLDEINEIDDSFQQCVDLQHPDDREIVSRTVKDYYEGRADSFKINYRMKTKSGSYKWIQNCGKIYERDADGKPIRLCGTYADITDQKEVEGKIRALLAEKELILKEVHHRIKNNMNTISSLLSLQANSISEPTAIRALEDAQSRIHSMSLLYDQLYRSADFQEFSIKEYLSSLVDDVLENFPNRGIVRVEKNMGDFNLDTKRLQPLGIIINELLTNIMKYAFKDRESGLIIVTASNSEGHVTISVQDDGLGMPESVSFDNSTGFGLQLVQGLTQQLNGTIRIERGNGTKVVLEFPL